MAERVTVSMEGGVAAVRLNRFRGIALPLALLAFALSATDAGAAPFAYIGHSENDFSVIDTASSTVAAMQHLYGAPQGVAVARSGARVYLTLECAGPSGFCGNGSLLVIDTAGNVVLAAVPVGASPYGVAVNPAGTRVYVANRQSNTLSVIDATSNTVIGTLPSAGGPVGVVVSPDGGRLYVTNEPACDPVETCDPTNLTAIDTATNAVTATIPLGTYPSGVALSPDGSRAYVANRCPVGRSPGCAPDGAPFVAVIDTSSNTVLASPKIGTGSLGPDGVAALPDGSRVYVTNQNAGTVTEIDTNTNTVSATITVGVFPVGVAVTPDGARVYVTRPRSAPCPGRRCRSPAPVNMDYPLDTARV